MPDLDLTLLERAEKAATQAPWDPDGVYNYVVGDSWEEDRELIVLLRNAAPALLAAARENERLRAALELGLCMPDAGFNDQDPRWEWWHQFSLAARAALRPEPRA